MKDDGGPAFPTQRERNDQLGIVGGYGGGMSLRDAFAIAALQGICAGRYGRRFKDAETMIRAVNGIVPDAWGLADEMLNARK